jgi:TrmH family RNA methyltransferase
MGNIGTIIRTMVGFGYSDLALIRPSADIFDPMIVRSAMGSLFQIRFKYFSSIDEYINTVGERKNYLFMLNGANDIQDIKFENPHSLMFGNESSGLPAEFAKFGESVFLKHSKNIDSLNLSVAAGIAMYKSGKV